MQRHFSSRGEALSEVTAARVLARRTPSQKAVAKGARRSAAEQWFVRVAERTHRPEKKQVDRNEHHNVSVRPVPQGDLPCD